MLKLIISSNFYYLESDISYLKNNGLNIDKMKFVNSYFKSKKILFLGYDTNSTRLIKELEIRGYEVIHCENNIQFDNYYLAISFGYRHILSSKTIRAIDCPIINLHMSFLPYNKGAHPYFGLFMTVMNVVLLFTN